MLGPSWIQLFRRIPSDLHHNLSVVTVTGLEVVIQSIVRLESEYAILRGRMAGTNDAGRVLIVPYDQMTFLGFNKLMMDPEIQAVFGTSEFAALAPATHAEVSAPPAPAGSLPGITEVKEPSANGQTIAKPAPVSKSILLARLRQRLAGGAK